MMTFYEYMSPKWYVFSGNNDIIKSKAIHVDTNSISWIFKGQYFEGIKNDDIFIVTSPGTSLFKKGNKIKIESSELLDEYQSENQAAKESELVFKGYKDPEGKNFLIPVGSKFN